jgi:hypothetical protein
MLLKEHLWACFPCRPIANMEYVIQTTMLSIQTYQYTNTGTTSHCRFPYSEERNIYNNESFVFLSQRKDECTRIKERRIHLCFTASCCVTSLVLFIFQYVIRHVRFLFMTCSEMCVLSSGHVIKILMPVTLGGARGSVVG